MSAISVEGLTRRFGDLVAMDNLTFDVPTGGVVGFVGPNGSGKSTTIRVLLGLIAPSGGTGTVLGESIAHPERFAGRVGALIDSPAFVGSLTGKDNLRSLAALRGVSGKRVDEVLHIVGLAGRENDKAATYSLGMKQRLAIAAALLPDPELLILDEPTNGLDPAGIVEVRELLRSLATDGRTVVVSSHLLGEIQAMVDSLVIIRFGVLVYAGSLEGLMEKATERVVVAPELDSEMSKLVEVVRANGWTCEVSGDRLVVEMQAERSAELGRAATAAGLNLRMLNPEADTLETVFLRLTGATDADLSEQRREQRHAGES
ncbi:MAG TPA: ABC transporter ATP-binding protein [Gaiellaceae bacterium]|jgi:ABC-2 type transport system ATP-binding protein|nr:ABC transporter ATP-binding protein [Gaiellaceae bacterium]